MKMRTTLTALMVVGLAFAAPVGANATTTSDVLHAKVDGASVVPGPGDANAKGTFKGTIKNGEFCYKLHVKQIRGVTTVGIYAGEEGTNGDLLVSLNKTIRGARGCTTIVADADDTTATLSESEAAALVANPDQFYVQLDTERYPNGAVRGQLR